MAAPTTLHHQIGMECLRRGVHILMEKPLAASVVEAHALDDLAVPSGLVLQVGHVERFNPTFVELANVLRDHKVLAVEARRLSPFATRAADVSVVYDLMVHDLDLILNLIDAPVRMIEATGSRIRSPQPDHALALLSFDTGQVASLAASKITQHKVRQMAITCAEAFVVADMLSRTVMIYRQSAADYFAQRGEVLYRQEGLIEQVYVPQIEPLYAEVQHFLSCVRERRQPLVGSTDAIRVMTVADVIEAARAGRPVSMIPLKLTLHNFLCYRDPAPLDFSGLHLACLSGNNGHGKTALLDAMTWALWGRARSNQADDLIHLGQVDMWVDFEFALGPSRYRAVRSRERKGRSGKSDLQLQVWQPGQEDGEWRPITEPTIRETEQRIVDLLRMDYDTFINSAFLMQGRADEFTIKPPNQRKQILADILGLGAYDEFENRAKEQARQYKDQATRLETHLKAIDAELALEPQIQVELETALSQSDTLTGQLRSAEQLQQALRAERQDLQAQSRSLDDLQSRLKRTERDLTEAEGQLTLARQRLATDQAILESQAEIESGFLALKQAEQLDQAWNDRLKRQVELQARHSRLEQTVSQASQPTRGAKADRSGRNVPVPSDRRAVCRP